MNPYSKPKRVCTGFQFLEGPVWVDAKSPLIKGDIDGSGGLLFSDIPANRIYWLADGYRGIAREPTGHANGNALDSAGSLLSCEHKNRCVSRFDGRQPAIPVVKHYEGKRLNSPNDVAVRSNGAIFFTDPAYGISDDLRELDFQGVYCVVKAGDEPVLLCDDFEKPNGLAFSVDEAYIYIADTERGHLRRYAVGTEGTFTDEQVFCECERPDGICVDTDGNVWIACMEGVEIFDSGARRLGMIRLPERPANVAFGGDYCNILYICARTSLYAVETSHTGSLRGQLRQSNEAAN